MSKHLFVIGAQRSSTTYLYHVLNDHPMIEMAEPVKPEPKFFLQPLEGLTQRDYLDRHFQGKTHPPILGEKSTTYIESEEAAQRIVSWYPDATIVVMVREPIARAISNYHFSVNSGLETLPFDRAIWEESDRCQRYDRSRHSASPYAYLKRGRYIDYLRTWLQYFPKDQVVVLVQEEAVGSLQQIQMLYHRLGVDALHRPRMLNQVINASEKRDGLASLSAEVKQYLMNYFAESNAALEAFLGRAIPDWI